MITYVAIKDRNGRVWSLPAPNRHHNVIHLVHVETGDREKALHLLGEHIQGFLNDTGTFLDRIQAWHEAKKCNQILPPYNPINPTERR